MNKAMKMMMVVGAVLCTSVCLARPHGGPGGHGGPGRGPSMHHGGGFRPAPAPMHHHGGHHGGHHGSWGHGGRNFWPGFVGGVVGGIVYDAITPSPVVVTTPTVYTTPVVTTPVVTTPVYSTQNVWVEGRYVDQVQANGTIIRIWQPGHYEQRQVVVQ